jgi:hypothetical protein
MPELLRLFESALALRISLFRFMMGVSAKGSAIFVVLSSSGAAAFSGAGRGAVCGAGVWSGFWRFFFTVTGRNPGLGERSWFALVCAREGLFGEGDLISWKVRLARPVLGAAFSSGLLGSFPLGFFWAVFGAASSLGADSGFCALPFSVREAALVVDSGASAVCSAFELLVAGFLLGFARFVNSKSPSLLS